MAQPSNNKATSTTKKITKPTKKTANAVESLSTDDFRNMIYEKGWNFRALAERWGFTEGYVGKLAKKKNRGKHFDDAVIGLPIIKHHYKD